jgi:hypothetical protein
VHLVPSDAGFCQAVFVYNTHDHHIFIETVNNILASTKHEDITGPPCRQEKSGNAKLHFSSPIEEKLR